jgi:hypothetical protein
MSSKKVDFDSSVLDVIATDIVQGSGAFKSLPKADGKMPQKSPAQVYFNKHQIMDSIEDVVHEVALNLPERPFKFMSDWFRNKEGVVVVTKVQSPRQFSLTSQLHAMLNPQTTGTSSSNVETKLPPEEVDEKFVSYLSQLATTVRRGTT